MESTQDKKSPPIRLSLEADQMAIAQNYAEATLGTKFPKYVTDLVLADLRAKGLISADLQATPAEARELCIWLKSMGGAPIFPIVYQNAETTKSVSLDAYIEYLEGKSYFQRTRKSTNEKVCLRLRHIRQKYDTLEPANKTDAPAVLAQLAVGAANAIP